MSRFIFSRTEESLAQLEAVQARLAQNERDLQSEIASLHEEHRREQDPNRMQLIQEMISVRKFHVVCWHGTIDPNLCPAY